MKQTLTPNDVAFLDSIEGWLSFNESLTLFDLVCESPNKLVVEIGAWKGRSTAWLWMASELAHKHLYTIDHFKGSSEHKKMYGETLDTYPDFCKNMTRLMKLIGVTTPIHVLKESSDEAVERFDDNSIGMLFIDASHEYEFVKQDLDLWLPKVSTIGIIALHDSNFVGVNRAIQELNLGPMWNINDSILSFRKYML